MTDSVRGKGFGPAGRAFWRSVVARFELETDEKALLAAVCRTLDVLAALEAAVEPGVVALPDGRPLPLLVEARQQRLVLAKLLGQLGLADVERPGAASRVSEQASAAAMARWKERRRGA